MKIPLNTGQQDPALSKKAAQAKALERDILKAKTGDWEAKKNLIRTFNPLLHTLAEKRYDKPADVNTCIDLGKEGLFKAAKKYKASIGPKGFQIFALDFIEAAMDGKGGGFFSRLFGK